MALFDSLFAIADFPMQIPNIEIEELSQVLKEWNPWNDIALDEMTLIRANVVKEYKLRTGNYRRTYWDRLSFDEQVFAEAEADWLEALFAALVRIENRYIEATYLDRAVQEFDKWFEAGLHVKAIDYERRLEQQSAQLIHSAESSGRVQVLSDAAVAEGMAMYGATIALLPSRYPIHSRHMDWLTKPSFNTEPELLPTPVTRDAQLELQLWREKLTGVQSAMHASWARVVIDCVNHRHMNMIHGRQADSHLLLANDGVPLPTADSFQGWFLSCGISLQWLDKVEQLKASVIARFKCRALMTYILPALPMTKEHAAYSLVQTADSTADHSLSSKSKAHERDENNRIRFGQWRVRTVLLGAEPGMVYTVADEALSTLERRPMAIHEQHVAMLPSFRSTVSKWLIGGISNKDAFLPGLNLDEANMAVGVHVDPSIRGSTMPLLWSLGSRALSTPWMSMAQQYRMFFRFSWSQEGKAAADLWCSAFETAAAQWLYASPAQRKRWTIRNLVEHTRYIRGNQDKVVAHGKSGDTTFDMSIFD